MNKVIMIGNLTRDPEAFTTQNGIARSKFDIAVQRRYKDTNGKREADFFTVIAWRQTADFVNKYLTKGRKVAVEGCVQNRSYTAQDGSKRWATEIIADSVEAVGGRESEQINNEARQPSNEGFTEVDDPDLPF